MTLVVFLMISCRSEERDHQVLRLGFIPFESAEQLLQDVQPLIQVIEKGMDMEVRPYVAADYTGVVEAFKGGNLDAAFMSPASYVLGHQEAGIEVILKSHRKREAFYFGTIITRADSPIKTLEDLKGKSFSFGDPLSTSGHVFPRKILLDAGINPNTDFENVIYSGSHDATILAILNKKVDAGATYADDNQAKSAAWTRFLSPEEQKQIRVLAFSDPIPADNICVSKFMSAEQKDRLQKTMLDYSDSPDGKKLMKELYHFDGYMKASNGDYEPVRQAFEMAGISLKETLKKN